MNTSSDIDYRIFDNYLISLVDNFEIDTLIFQNHLINLDNTSKVKLYKVLSHPLIKNTIFKTYCSKFINRSIVDYGEIKVSLILHLLELKIKSNFEKFKFGIQYDKSNLILISSFEIFYLKSKSFLNLHIDSQNSYSYIYTLFNELNNSDFGKMFIEYFIPGFSQNMDQITSLNILSFLK